MTPDEKDHEDESIPGGSAESAEPAEMQVEGKGDEGGGKMRLLEDSELFRALAPEEQSQLLDSARWVSFDADEALMTEGDEGECFYLMEKGEVEVSTVSQGRKVVLATLSRGAIIGEVSLYSNQPRTATVTALGPVSALRFENIEFRPLLAKHPRLLKRLQSMILTRARDTIQKLMGPPG